LRLLSKTPDLPRRIVGGFTLFGAEVKSKLKKMANTTINQTQTPNPTQPKPKAVIQPLPPTMFTGKQGFFLILVLVAAVIGWVLYLNK